jgi:hypothetical protein
VRGPHPARSLTRRRRRSKAAPPRRNRRLQRPVRARARRPVGRDQQPSSARPGEGWQSDTIGGWADAGVSEDSLHTFAPDDARERGRAGADASLALATQASVRTGPALSELVPCGRSERSGGDDCSQAEAAAARAVCAAPRRECRVAGHRFVAARQVRAHRRARRGLPKSGDGTSGHARRVWDPVYRRGSRRTRFGVACADGN